MTTTTTNAIRVSIESRFSDGKYGGWGLALAIAPGQWHVDPKDVKSYDGMHLAFNSEDLARENLAIINDSRRFMKLPVFVEA
jgi:hypothetical protein